MVFGDSSPQYVKAVAFAGDNGKGILVCNLTRTQADSALKHEQNVVVKASSKSRPPPNWLNILSMDAYLPSIAFSKPAWGGFSTWLATKPYMYGKGVMNKFDLLLVVLGLGMLIRDVKLAYFTHEDEFHPDVPDHIRGLQVTANDYDELAELCIPLMKDIKAFTKANLVGDQEDQVLLAKEGGKAMEVDNDVGEEKMVSDQETGQERSQDNKAKPNLASAK